HEAAGDTLASLAQERGPPHELTLVDLDAEAEARFEGRVPRGEIVPPAAEALLESQRVQRVVANRSDAEGLPGPEHDVPYPPGVRASHDELPAQLADEADAGGPRLDSGHVDQAGGEVRERRVGHVGGRQGGH